MSERIPAELEHLVAALRKPVHSRPGLKDRVMRAAHAEGVPRRGGPFRPRLLVIGGALAAGLAVVAVYQGKKAPDAARLIPFVVTAPNVQRVSIVGDFNDWDPRATPMVRLSGNAWGVVVKLQPGRYRYSFLLDGSRYLADPAAPRAAGDDFGLQSSIATIGARRL